MEIELKYTCKKEVAMQIFEDLGIINSAGLKKIPMEAVYYDTKDKALREIKYAYRIRREGDGYVCTVKYGSGSGKSKKSAALKKRREDNASVDSDFMNMPRIDVFEDMPCYGFLDKALGGQYSDNMGIMRPLKKLIPVIENDFLRTEHEIVINEANDTRAVISYDEGLIKAGGKTDIISELEIELISGSEDDLLNFGEDILKKYDILEGLKSKYSRGLKLLTD